MIIQVFHKAVQSAMLEQKRDSFNILNSEKLRTAKNLNKNLYTAMVNIAIIRMNNNTKEH